MFFKKSLNTFPIKIECWFSTILNSCFKYLTEFKTEKDIIITRLNITKERIKLQKILHIN